jgi:predicted RND superfamily exporter protein
VNRLARLALRSLSLRLLLIHRWSLHRPRTVLALALLATLGFGVAATRARMALSVPDLVGRETRAVRWMDQMDAQFGGGHQLLLFFAPAGPGRALAAGELETIRSFLERERRENPELLSVESPWDARRAARVEGRLRLVPVLGDDQQAGLRALAASPLGGLLTDRQGRDVAAELQLRDSLTPGLFGRFDPRPVGELLARAQAELAGPWPEVRVHAGGAAAFEWYALEAQRRITLLNLAVVVLMVLACRLLLGTWRGGVLLVLLVGWAGTLVYGGLALWGQPVDMLTSGLFLMLAVAAIEDFIFIAWERLAHGASWRRAFRVLLLPGALTSLTTVIGFASLCAADLPIVRRFGLWGAMGAALEWVAAFLILPALLRLAPRLRGFAVPARAVPASFAAALARPRLPRWAARAALLLVPLGALAALRLDFNDSPDGFFDRGHPYGETADYTARTRGWRGAFHVVLPEDASPSDATALGRRLAATPGVAGVLDPGTVLASLTGGDELARFELAADLATLRGGLSGREGRLRALVFLADNELATVTRVRDEVLRSFPGGEGFPAGELVAYADFAEAVPRVLMHSLGTCLALVGLLVVLLYRAVGLGGGLRAVAASALGPAAALIALAASGQHVSFVTAVFASVLVGLTGDNAVQFACAAWGGSLRGGLARRGGAASMVALVMATCALTFVGSVFVPPRALGALLAFGLVAAFLGDTWVLGRLWSGSAPDGGLDWPP